MNETSNEHSSIFCPSCGASVTEHAEHGALLRCPVCGTEFRFEPEKTSESSITEADQALTASAQKRKSTEAILLDRLKNEPPDKTPIPNRVLLLLLGAVIVIVFGIFEIVSKPNAYAPDTHGTMQQHLAVQHVVDSLQDEIAKNPANIDLHLQLADADYDAGSWADSKHEFEIYLAQKPHDADARVDYSYAIAQNNGDLTTAISEIDTALMYQPDHLNALINAGIMTAQTVSDSNHATALAKAKDYFERARNVASKTNPGIAARIDTLIMEIDSTGLKMR